MARLCGLLTLAVWITFSSQAQADEKAGVGIEVHQDYLDFRIGQETVTRYHIAQSVVKPYFWPVLGPQGVAMTRAWPMEKAPSGGSNDHPHQKSAWFCHGDVIPEGIVLKEKVRGVEGVDFWSEHAGHGQIVCVSATPGASGDLATRNEWRTADGVKIMDEARNIHLHAL